MQTSKPRKHWSIVILLAAVAAAIALWMLRGKGSDSSSEQANVATAAQSGSQSSPTAARNSLARVDPKTLKRGSISGKVSDDKGGVIANASVCADITNADVSQQQLRDPICTTTDTTGRYSFADLLQATYSLDAGAEGYSPQTFLPMPNDPQNSKVTDFFLSAGEQRTDVNFVLSKDGVLLTGTVTDISGGPIAGARVRAQGRFAKNSSSTPTTTDEQGRYRLWVRGGGVWVSAVAEGYAENTEGGWAPGEVDVKLTPESGLAGIVRDESGAPVAGAAVNEERSWNGSSDITDENGRFRITRLTPGRYKLSASSDHGFGMAKESTLLGLGQFVDGIEIVLHSASMVTGRMVLPGSDKKACKRGWVSLRDDSTGQEAWGSPDATGLIILRGLRAGTYKVTPHCRGYRAQEKLPTLVVVTGKNLLDQEWPVESGSRVSGTVTRKDGHPIEGVSVRFMAMAGGRFVWSKSSGDETDANGKYELNGLQEGTYSAMISTSEAAKPKTPEQLEVAANTTIVKNFVLENGGAIRATVTDSDGKPVKGVTVSADKVGNEQGFIIDFGGNSGPTETGADGVMTVRGLIPGQYRASVRRSWTQPLRKAGTTDNDRQTELVTVKDGETVDVKFVVESERGEISGVVQTDTGEAISDAYVIAVRESDADGADNNNALQSAQWDWNDNSVLADPQGKFTVKKLAPGKYTLRGFRKGGGEATLQHVAVGSNIVIVVKSGGSISGAVAGVDASGEMEIEVTDRKTKVERSESFYGTAGAFVMRDLPAGEYDVTATVGKATGTAKVALANNEAKTGVTIKIGHVVTVVGKLVDLHTKAPVANMHVSVRAVAGGQGGWFDDEGKHSTNAQGVFRIEGIPIGKVSLWSNSMLPEFAWYGASVMRTIPDAAVGEYDFGELPVVAKRTKQGQPVGEDGIVFKEHSDWTETYPMEIARIEPGGPASKTELKVGDVITAIDGIDIRGERVYLGSDLLAAPPGTKVAITVERGVTVSIVLVPPK